MPITKVPVRITDEMVLRKDTTLQSFTFAPVTTIALQHRQSIVYKDEKCHTFRSACCNNHSSMTIFL
jgi:hypothetical protein